MGRLQTEMGSPSSLSEIAFGDTVTKPKGRLARPSRGVKTSLESAESMIDGGAKDTLIHEISNKYQYESKLEGNEGAPISRYQNINSEHFAYIMFEPTRYEKDLQPYINAYGPTLRIPVSPATLAISKESEHNEVQSIMFGGILERNAPGLRHFAVTSFIPGTPYTTGYGDYGFQNYYPWAEDRGDGQRVYTNGTLEDGNLICTQTGWISFVNLLMDRRIILKFHLIKAPAFRHRDECFHVCIKSFTYQHNPHDDLDYTIEFVEWREPTIKIGEEQVIDVAEPPAKKKSPGGGKILLVMHEFQGVNTMILHNSTQILLQIHGGGHINAFSGFRPQMNHVTTTYEKQVEMLYDSIFLAGLKSAKLSDVDLRPTKMTSVSLGVKPSNMSGGMNVLGYKAYHLSQLSKSGYADFQKRIHSLPRSTTLTARSEEFDYDGWGAHSVMTKVYTSLVKDCIRVGEKYILDVARDVIKSAKWLQPSPLKLYDGGEFTGLGESGETLTWDGSIQAHRRNLTDITDTVSLATATTAATSENFTRNPAYDPESKTMNVNRSGLHKLIIDETGQVRYDDLVRRIRKFDIQLKDWKIGVQISIVECRVTVTRVPPPDGQPTKVYAECAFYAELRTEESQVSNDLYSTVDTVGVKLHKGQRITVLDSHLREPTKQELELQSATRQWNSARGGR